MSDSSVALAVGHEALVREAAVDAVVEAVEPAEELDVGRAPVHLGCQQRLDAHSDDHEGFLGWNRGLQSVKVEVYVLLTSNILIL